MARRTVSARLLKLLRLPYPCRSLVWRNRLRGNNQLWTPHIALALDMADDAAVRQAVLAALSKGEKEA